MPASCRCENIGRGGYGTIWREKEMQSQKFRAVKRVPKHAATWDYKKEIAAMAKCRQFPHHFAYMHGWYEDDDCIFLAIDWFEFGDLSQCVNAQIPEEQAKDITGQLCAGLSAIHQMGLTHRDLKPQNVFVVARWPPSWSVRIGDFGISKRVQQNETALRTMTGTQAYMAPEIFPWLMDDDETHVYTMAVDMWALGVVIYQLLTFQLPFGDHNPLYRYCKSSSSFPEAPLLDARVTTEGINIVKLLLQSHPGDRLTSSDSLTHPWLCKAVSLPRQAGSNKIQSNLDKALELRKSTDSTLSKAAQFDLTPPRILVPHAGGDGSDQTASHMSGHGAGDATSQLTNAMIDTLMRASGYLLHDSTWSDESALQSNEPLGAVEHGDSEAVKLTSHKMGGPERPKVVQNKYDLTIKHNYRVRVIEVSGLKCPVLPGTSIWNRILNHNRTSDADLPGIFVRIFVGRERFDTRAIKWRRHLEWDESFDLAFSRNETLAVSIRDERKANSKFSRALARDYIITKKLIGLPVDEEKIMEYKLRHFEESEKEKDPAKRKSEISIRLGFTAKP